jgi:DNA-binding transcriptional LysR family regulator
MNDITLQQIEIFLTVAEQLSLSEAAKDLFLNQSAVSRWIQRLEISLDAKLFRRNNRGVELTEHGEFLYAELKPLYDKLSITLKNIRSIYNFSDNILRVGCLDSSEVLKTLRAASVDFGHLYPETLIKIELHSFEILREKLLCGDLDCIVLYALGFGNYLNVHTKKIKRLDTFVAVPRKSSMAEADVIPAGRLGEETLYLLYIAEMKDAEARAIETCRKIGFLPREIKYMQSHFALELAVKNGKGISIGGRDLLDHFSSDIKLYHVQKPYQDQYVIIAWREHGCHTLAQAFIHSIDACIE